MNILEIQQSPAAYRDALLIDTDGGPRPLRECLDPWQRDDFAALDDGWRRAVVGSTVSAKYQRGWLERGRGHSKTGDLAVMVSWTLFASRRPLSGIGAAGDQEQARLLRDAIGRLCYYNPWLAAVLEVQNYRVINSHTGSSLDIITSDAPTSYGLTPDFIIADEVVHWKKRDLWDSLLSSAAKRSNCMFVVITNAGIALEDEWQWQTREIVRTDTNWYFSRLDGPIASWITKDRLAEQERLLPGVAFQRLWMNQWTSGGGDALRPEEIAAAFIDDLQPATSAVPGFQYVAGLDAGVSRDASALCVLGIRRSHYGHGQIRLAHTQVWRPTKGQKVNLADVENALLDAHERFNLKTINYDPWELRYLASRLQAGGVGRIDHNRYTGLPLIECPATGQVLQRVASSVLEAFNDRRLELYHNDDLRRDLTRLRVEERSYGFRLVSPRDMFGHGDLGTAFSLAVLAASELAAKPAIVVGPIFTEHSNIPYQQRQQQYLREQQSGNQSMYDQSLFRDAMKFHYPQRFN